MEQNQPDGEGIEIIQDFQRLDRCFISGPAACNVCIFKHRRG